MVFSNCIISVICWCISTTYGVDVSIDVGQSSYTIRGSDATVLGRTIYTFKKIPYAKPPIGSLRFKYAQALDNPPWTGIYNATVSPPTCWQGAATSSFDLNNPSSTMWYSTVPMNEDCLYLSIWSPAIGTSQNLPVMVWIYGGSYMSGSNNLLVYDGSILASLYSVVVVSIQFRVGPLGFLFFADTESPGNQALMDQRMALQWISSNIVKFGGNPNSITIFSESSGACSLSIHTFSPLSANYFQKVIFQSGNLITPWAIESPPSGITKAQYFAAKANCTSDTVLKTVNCLRNLTPQQIFDLNFLIRNQIADSRKSSLQKLGYTDIYSDVAIFFDIYFRPVYDDNFVNQNTISQLLQGTLTTNKVFLFGTNANEAMFFLIYGLSNYFDVFIGSNIQLSPKWNYPSTSFVDPYKIVLENLLNVANQYPAIAQLVLYEYNIPSTIFGDTSWTAVDLIKNLDRLGSDAEFVCPTVLLADSLTKMGQNNVYMYTFNVTAVKMPLPSWVGVMHGYEIEFVFGMPYSSAFASQYFAFTEEEKNISNIVMSMWTNFAKYGNPTPTGTATNGKAYWPLYTFNDKQYLQFSKDYPDKIQIGANYRTKECRLWSKVLPILRNSLGNYSNGGRSLIVDCSVSMITTTILMMMMLMTFMDTDAL